MVRQVQDPLEDYRAKRNFAHTREPDGKAVANDKAAGGLFVVQKHDATRLHFDFRIELDGVLKSWAITRGPSNNPADKRLAVRVEDHPLDYGSFEGTIPKGEYGGGTVMLWDQGTWEPLGDPHAGLEGGDLKMRLHGERMKGEWVLVHMKGRDTTRSTGPSRENWLLIKHKDSQSRDKDTLTERFTRSVSTARSFDEIARGAKVTKPSTTPNRSVWHSDVSSSPLSVRALKKLPPYRAPQLAKLVDAVPTGPDWLFEMKYDGYRCLAAVAGDAVRLYTRNGQDWTQQFGALVEPLRQLSIQSALIDGEICALDKRGRTDFSTLKSALADGSRLEFFAFDLLESDGKDLTELPLLERKQRLSKLLQTTIRHGPVQYSEHVREHGDAVLAALCRDGHEGVIAKRAEAPYRGERNGDWLKIKCVKRQEFVIGGWSPSSKRSGFASLLLGAWDGKNLLYRGRVGTGFSQDDVEQLSTILRVNERQSSPFVATPDAIARTAHWTEPKLVAEIAYAELTGDGVLRHPSFIGLRNDKPAREVTMEKALSGGVEAAAQQHVRLTSPDRIVFPGQGITKADLVAYYAAVQHRMLPHVSNRPLSLVRCPDGEGKTCFFQKHDTGGFPEQLKSTPIVEKDGSREDYFYLDDLAGLIAGTQMNVLEWHIWGSRIADVERPDRLVFDIDPDVGLDFANVVAAALDIRDRLARHKLQSYPMLSGGKGIHVIVPLLPKADWDMAKTFAHDFAQTMAEESPDQYTANLSKAKRKGRMFIDYLRNERGSTAISPWSVRSRDGAPVALPITWDEVSTVKAANAFSIAEAAARISEPDPWPDYFSIKQSLAEK